MKLASGSGRNFCRSPDPGMLGALLYGPDAGYVQANRQRLVSVLTERDDLRLSQLDPGQIRSDPGSLWDALRARGFFPGRRVVLIENAGDGVSGAVETALDGLDAEDAFLLMTGGTLAARSSLRKLFENSGKLASIGLYADQLDPATLQEMVRDLGAKLEFEREAEAALISMAADLDAGSFRQLLEKLVIARIGQDGPVGIADVEAIAPGRVDADLDALIQAVAGGAPEMVGPVLRRMGPAAASPIQIMRVLSQYFQQLFAIAASPEGPDAAIGKLRPPVFGPRRTAMRRHASIWGRQAETGLRLLYETDRSLRSAGTRPDMALAERCLLRLAMMGARSR